MKITNKIVVLLTAVFLSAIFLTQPSVFAEVSQEKEQRHIESSEKPQLFPPSAALPIPPAAMKPTIEVAGNQTPVTPAPEPTWIRKAQYWFRVNVKGQQALQNLPLTSPGGGNRLFQQAVEETPSADKAKQAAN